MSNLTFISIPRTPGETLRTSVMEMQELYHFVSQLKNDAEQARRDFYQTCSEYASAQKAKNPTPAYLRERAEACTSAIIRVFALREPFYRGIQSLQKFLQDNLEEYQNISAFKFRTYWVESYLKRHNFVCAHELLKESFRTYSQLIQVNPEFTHDSFSAMDAAWDSNSSECDSWPALPFRSTNGDTELVADLLMSVLSLASNSGNTFDVSTYGQSPVTVKAVKDILEHCSWRIEELPKSSPESPHTSVKVRKPRRRAKR